MKAMIRKWRNQNESPIPKIDNQGPVVQNMSIVNDSLKFQKLIHCYFLLKKCENPLHCSIFAFEVYI